MNLPTASDSGEEGGRRPDGGLRSAREGFTPSRPLESATPGAPPPAALGAPRPEERAFMDAAGAPWTVRVRGRGLSGTPPDRGAPLLLLQFRREEGAAEGEGTGELLERLVVARGLEGLTEEELQGFLSAALALGS